MIPGIFLQLQGCMTTPASPASTRRLAAIWFADIVGFTGISAKDERIAMSLVSLLQLCARRAVGHHGGRLVKFIGDEAMAEFGSTDSAVLAALELRLDFTGLSAKHSTPALLRIGVHLGDVVTSEGDIYGDGVNTTSRIEREARPGEILVSEEVWRQLRKRTEFVLEDRGERELRGLDGSLRLYSVTLGEAPEHAQSPGEPLLPDSWAIAVLPFIDISPAHDNEYFSDGMTEELIHSLSRVDGLRVASRTSSYAFKGRSLGIKEIAQALRVNVVLEGSVRKVGTRVRVTPLLIDATNGYQLWTETFERELENVFDLQETISGAIVDALQIKLGPEQIVREHTRDTLAYDEYLKGRFHWNRHSPADFQKSIGHYERAIAADPGYALAWAGLADTYCTMGAVFLARPGDVYPRAKEAARKAIDLDPRLAPAHAALAEVQVRYEWDWEEAERGFRRALALDPEYADARYRYANLLRDLGRFDEAIVEVRRAQGADPYSLPISAAVAGVFYHARRYDEAIAESRRAVEQAPTFYNASYYLAVSYLMKGMPEEAVRHFQRVHELSSVPASIAGIIVAYAAAGRREEAIALQTELLEMAEGGAPFAYPVASACVALGDREQAFRWFDRAVEERTSWLTSLRVEPRFEHLHGDPRFRRLLERVGLVPREARSKHNLPAQQTSMLGRERDLREVERLLHDSAVRIVTLVGPGGVGKTRLALESASRGLDGFPDGVWFVPLSAVDHPELLLSTIARALGLREAAPDPQEALVAELRDARTLLVLDGFEHLLPAASALVDLLAELPDLRVIVTSQAVLRVRGERVFLVQPLGFPEAGSELNASQLEGYGAVALFMDRMEAVKPAYRPNATDLEAIVEICRQLDGLPLAIELAAARLRLMPPPALLGRLENRFVFLVEGPRDLPQRHQTLEAVCDWSYGLLDPREQATFRDLAPFSGGCSLEAAEWMERGRTAGGQTPQGGDRREVLDLLASLVEKSLLRQVETGEGEPRFQMLETIRQYGLRLIESLGESAAVRGRQLDYLLDLGLRAESALTGPDQAEWLDRLERDYENMVAVMDWGLEAGEVEKAVRLGSAMWWFFWLRGHFGEMRKRLDLALQRGGGLPGSLRANLHVASGAMATLDGEDDLAARHFEQAVALERERDDPRGMPRALRGFASALANLGQYEAAVPFYEEALRIDRDLGNRAGESAALRGMGKMALSLGDLDGARDHFDKALVIARSMGGPQYMAYALAGLGDVAREQGRLAEATRLYEEGLRHCREIGSRPGVLSALQNLALMELASHDLESAEARFTEALQMARSLGDRGRLAISLLGLGRISVARENPERGVRLIGAARHVKGSRPTEELDRRHGESERSLATAREALGVEGVERLLEEARSMPLATTVEWALGQSPKPVQPGGAA